MKHLFPLLLAGTLSACVNYAGIGSDKHIRAVDQLHGEQSLGAEAGEWPIQHWWKSFNDPQLNALIDEALTNSPALAAAETRVARANAALENSQANAWPDVTGSAAATYQRYTENGQYPPPFAGAFKGSGDIRIQARYEVDFWGRNRAAVAAARSRQQATAAETASTRLLLASAVAKTYAQLAQWQSIHAIGGNALKQRERIVALAQQRVDAGLDTQIELKQAQTQLPLTRALLAQVDERIVNTQHALAALLGAGPDRALAVVAALPESNAEFVARAPSDLPVELLGHRPDIIAARWRVEAALRDTDRTKAEFYPNVNLAAFAGFSSIGLDKLMRSGSAVYGGGPAISLPIFDSGRLRSGLKADYAVYDAAVANYDETLVAALRDVADQLNSYRSLQPQSREANAALASAQETLDLAQQRYHAGLGNYLTVLSAETAVFQQQLFIAQLQARALTLRIELARAFGGGFTADTAQPIQKNSAQFLSNNTDAAAPTAVANAQVSGDHHE